MPLPQPIALALGVAAPVAARAAGTAMTPRASSHYAYDATANSSSPTTKLAAISVSTAVSATRDRSRPADALVAAEAGNRVLWSGGVAARNAAMDYARANGAKVLEDTAVGRALQRLPYNTVTAKLWDVASAGFAATARGPVNVFIGSAFRGAESTFGRVEGPIVRLKGNPILQRFEDAW